MDSAGLNVDSRSLDKLRREAGENPRAAAKEAAEQFEALFMRQLLKTMRASIPSGGFTDSAGEKMAQEMLDDHLTTSMVGRPGGLSETLARHMSRYLPGGEKPEVVGAANAATAASTAAAAAAPSLRSYRPTERLSAQQTSAVRPSATVNFDSSGSPDLPGEGISFGGLPAQLLESLASAPAVNPTTVQGRFVNRLWPHAEAAEQATGVPAAFVLGQAALESGWGKGEMRLPDGRSAHNLFGIKAGSSWKGATVDVATTEYIDGKKTRQIERFRAYESYEASFNDWIGLMTSHPRYQNVLRQSATPEAFARGLQDAGYATDPRYADKLHQVIEQTIRLQKELA